MKVTGIESRTSSLIRTIRNRLELTQTEAADRLGISLSTFAKWDSGKRVPTLKSISKILQGLGVESAVLVVGSGVDEIRVDILTSKPAGPPKPKRRITARRKT